MQCTSTLGDSLHDVLLLAAGAESELLTMTSEGRQKGNAMTRAGLVLLCGYFEGYVRDLITEFIEILNDEKIDINLLPDSLFVTALEHLTSISNLQKKIPASAKLKESVRLGTSYKLDQKKLSNTGGNPTVDTIESIFSRIGIDAAIDKLSITDFGIASTYTLESQSEQLRLKISEEVSQNSENYNPILIDQILRVIDSKWTPSRKRRKIGYVHAIEELLRVRNLIAHGEGREPVPPSELLTHIENVEGIAKGLDTMVTDIIERLCPAPV